MSGSGSSEVRTSIFSGENYEFWRIKMVTIFKSHGLWNLVEKRVKTSDSKKNKAKESSEDDVDERMATVLMQDAKALGIIQNAEVVAILKSQEHQFDLHTVDTTERAFSSLSASQKGQNRGSAYSGKPQKNWNSKGKKWESKSKFQQRPFTNSSQNVNSSQSMNQEVIKPQCKVCSKFHFGECRHKGKPKCYNCDKFGHCARECTAGKIVQKTNSANQAEVSGTLFFANNVITEAKVNGEWYIYSGCSNYMTRNVNLLVDVRTNIASRVQMPTGDLVNVEGIGSLVIDTNKGRKYVREVMYLPELKENLLSVGQMDEHGYFLLFGGGI
ncbi:unnamed protein product [Malus baccata var. baccata]